MNLQQRAALFRTLRHIFNVIMGFVYLLLCYLILLISFSGKNDFSNSKLPILIITLCSIGQISQYHDAYKHISKNIHYYIGIIPPALALTCLIFAVTKTYFFG